MKDIKITDIPQRLIDDLRELAESEGMSVDAMAREILIAGVQQTHFTEKPCECVATGSRKPRADRQFRHRFPDFALRRAG